MTQALPERLRTGFQAFQNERFARERRRYEVVAGQQRPEIMVIGCSDSRVAPEAIFDAAPGEIFVVRNVANLVPPFETAGSYHGTSAALEFAVLSLRVKHIVVLGHASCGGITAYAQDMAALSPSNFIGQWVSLLAPAAEKLGERRADDDYRRRLEFAAIEMSLANLMTFACVRTLVERGRLALHGAHFGIADGVLRARDPATGAFEAVAAG